MEAYLKVLELIQSKPQNGHAVNNAKNVKSLTIVNREIEQILKDTRCKKN